MRATDKHRVHCARQTQHRGQLFGVDAAAVQRRIHILLREHGVQRKPCQIAVLQVFQLFLEHGAGGGAVAVDQGAAGPRVTRQQGLDDRQDGRDAAARRHRQHTLWALGQHGAKAALRGHHLQPVAGFHLAVQPAGEDTAFHAANADAQAIGRPGADGIRTPLFLPRHRAAQRQVLARLKVVQALPFGRHVKGQHQRVIGFGLHAAHRQLVEVQQAHNGLKCSKGSPHARQRCKALQAVLPKADRRSVSALAQRGQAMLRGRKRTVASTRPGGAMP